jgi:hypothetical protein
MSTLTVVCNSKAHTVPLGATLPVCTEWHTARLEYRADGHLDLVTCTDNRVVGLVVADGVATLTIRRPMGASCGLVRSRTAIPLPPSCLLRVVVEDEVAAAPLQHPRPTYGELVERVAELEARLRERETPSRAPDATCFNRGAACVKAAGHACIGEDGGSARGAMASKSMLETGGVREP